MKPYYEHAGITIYHGDCADVLPVIENASVDCIIADPPYNAGKNYGICTDDLSPLDYRHFMQDILREASRVSRDGVVFFPGTKNVLSVKEWMGGTDLEVKRLLGWHRLEFAGDKWSGGPAMCWEPVVWASRAERAYFKTIFGHQGRDFLVVPSTHGGPKDHPCPKPLAVMKWLVGLFVPPSGLCLDPCAGTGTTLVAAKDLERSAIGIEIEEKYCEIAAKRLSQEVLNFSEKP